MKTQLISIRVAVLALACLVLLMFNQSQAQMVEEVYNPYPHEIGMHPQVEALIQAGNPPDGIVFDIETLEPQALVEMAGYVRYQIKRLRQVFADADIAIVSHGAEEFALQSKSEQQYSKLHSSFSDLVNTDGVSIHVCGAVAGLGNLTKEDFPAFVSFSDSGMAQLNDYKALGYKVITIKSLTESERKLLFETPQPLLTPNR